MCGFLLTAARWSCVGAARLLGCGGLREGVGPASGPELADQTLRVVATRLKAVALFSLTGLPFALELSSQGVEMR